MPRSGVGLQGQVRGYDARNPLTQPSPHRGEGVWAAA